MQFVVITLIAGTPAADGGQQGSRAFATPTIVHLGAVLLLAAVLSAEIGGAKASQLQPEYSDDMIAAPSPGSSVRSAGSLGGDRPG